MDGGADCVGWMGQAEERVWMDGVGCVDVVG